MTIRVSKSTYQRLKAVGVSLDSWIDTASCERVASAFDGVAPKSDRDGHITNDAIITRLLVAYEKKSKQR